MIFRRVLELTTASLTLALIGHVAHAELTPVWTPLATVVPTDQIVLPLIPPGGYANAVAIKGTTAIVGSPSDPGTPGGSVYVYTFTAGAWVAAPKIVGPAGASGFGTSLAISGNTIIIGAPASGATGAAYVYNSTGPGTFGPGTMLALPPALLPGSMFGTSVDIDGNRLVVGAPGVLSVGAVTIYTRPAGGAWGVQQSLLGSTDLAFPATGAAFGSAVGIFGDGLVVGAPGYVNFSGAGLMYGFDGAQWNFENLSLGAVDSLLGTSVDVDGDWAAIGGPGAGLPSSPNGSVLMATRSTGTWTVSSTLVGPGDGVGPEAFGNSVALHMGQFLIIGAPLNDIPAFDAGAAYICELGSNDTWRIMPTLIRKLVPVSAEFFGTSVGLIGNPATGLTALCGTPGVPDLNGIARGEAAFKSVTWVPGLPVAFGGPSCPCNNPPFGEETGCVTTNANGMWIAAGGSASLAADNLTLTAMNVPPSNSGLFIVGDTLGTSMASYDGLHWLGGSTLRQPTNIFQTNGMASITGVVATFNVPGYFTPGTPYFFQYWSRDAAAGTSPCGTGANWSSAYEVTMAP